MLSYVAVLCGGFVFYVKCVWYFVYLHTFTTLLRPWARDTCVYHVVIHLDAAEYSQKMKMEKEKKNDLSVLDV